MVEAVVDRIAEQQFEHDTPELSAEAAIIIWTIASYPDPDQKFDVH